MKDKVQILSDASLGQAGFSEADVRSAVGREDGYVGERDGVKYYRAQNEFHIELGEHKSTVRMPDQQGERTG